MSVDWFLNIYTSFLQDKETSDMQLSISDISLRNIVVRKMVVASTMKEYSEIEFSRALVFLELCLRHFLHLEKVTITYPSGLTSIKFESNVSHVYGNVDVLLGNEINTHEMLLEILQWSKECTITYIEEREQRLTTIHIRIVSRDEKELYRNFKPNFLGLLGKIKDKSGIIHQIAKADIFPTRCSEITSHVKIFERQHSMVITCNDSIHLSNMVSSCGASNVLSLTVILHLFFIHYY